MTPIEIPKTRLQKIIDWCRYCYHTFQLPSWPDVYFDEEEEDVFDLISTLFGDD